MSKNFASKKFMAVEIDIKVSQVNHPNLATLEMVIVRLTQLILVATSCAA